MRPDDPVLPDAARPAPLAGSPPAPGPMPRPRPIRRDDDRAIALGGIVLAAVMLALAALAEVRLALGGTVWLPLHLALAGAAGTAIASILPFFT